MRAAILVSLLVLGGLAAPAFAQRPSEPAARAAYDAEIADQNRRSEALNVEVNKANAAVQARNDAAQTAYQRQLADWRSAKAEFEAAVANQKTDVEKAQAAYQSELTAWRARVAACQSGDRKACASGD
jgi:hypothetical protein